MSLMVIPLKGRAGEYPTVEGELIELWVGPEKRMFFIHTNYEETVVLSDFRSGLRVPHVDLGVGTPQEALDRVIYRFKSGYMLAVMSAYSQLNLL